MNQVWSTINPEYGSYNWLRRELSVKIGYDADSRLLSRTERAYVDSLIESGLMQFCHATWPNVRQEEDDNEGEEREPGTQNVELAKAKREKAPHRWSFLRTIHTFDTESGESVYIMPEDFGHCVGEPTTIREGGRIAIVREAHIRQLLSGSPQSGKPAYCATRKKNTGGSSSQITELLLYPTPDAIEPISVEYSVVPQAFDADNPYPPGGKEHAETLLASCCYVAAMRSGKGINEAAAHLRDRLAASIVIDRADGKPTAEGVWQEDDGRFNAVYLSRMIGRHIGAGPNQRAWSHQQTQLIAEILRRAIRRVYNPPVIPGSQYPHDWSFLRPTTTLTTEASKREYDLPADFAMLYGPVTHESGAYNIYPPIKHIGEGQIRQMHAQYPASTRPTHMAIRVKNHDETQGTRWEAIFYPEPDGVYAIEFGYRINPESINLIPVNDAEFPIHGGERFADMFLESCMLTADEMNGARRSPHEERFFRALQAAIGQDQMTHAPETFGVNRDMSDRRGEHFNDLSHRDSDITTYNGTTYY